MGLFSLFDKKSKPVWNFGIIPDSFNKTQIENIENAKWYWGKIKTSLKSGDTIATRDLNNCLYQIIFAHFKDTNGIFAGCCLDLSLPDVIEKAILIKDSILLPEMEKILRCQDKKRKAILTFQYVFILMAGVFDCSGGTIYHEALREVFESDTLNQEEKDYVRKNRGDYLKPLGFTPHYHSEGVTWYWNPSPKPEKTLQKI